MDKRTLRVIFNKSGGTASKNAVTTRLTIPKSWFDVMGITQDEREVIASFDGQEITIARSDIMADKYLEALERGYRAAYAVWQKNGGQGRYGFYCGYSTAFETALKVAGYTSSQVEEKCIAIQEDVKKGIK